MFNNIYNYFLLLNNNVSGLVVSALSAAALSLTLLPALAIAQEQQRGLSDLPEVPGLNTTQSNAMALIVDVCPSGENAPDFQENCNSVVGAGLSGLDNQYINSVQWFTPDQIVSQGVEATKISAGYLASISTVITARLLELRSGLAGVGAPGVQYGLSGKSVPTADRRTNSETGGGASADEAAILSRLGAYINVLYNTGDVDSTFEEQAGFDFDIWGVTAGADYQFTDNLIFGAAFSYRNSDANFKNNHGGTDSDSYNGSLYGSYYVTDRFYFEGIATYGAINYDTTRRVNYSIGSNVVTNGQTVNTKATADPDGYQYSFSLGGGYEYPLGALSVNPYFRLTRTKLHVDSYKENGGDGWATRVSSQNVRSLISTLGTQFSYAISTRWGVLLPQIRGEWNHEAKNDSRNIGVRFLGDLTSGGDTFNVVTDEPDKNFFNVGLGISGTFARGVSAFFDYDALLGYDDIDSHRFLVGARMEF